MLSPLPASRFMLSRLAHQRPTPMLAHHHKLAAASWCHWPSPRRTFADSPPPPPPPPPGSGSRFSSGGNLTVDDLHREIQAWKRQVTERLDVIEKRVTYISYRTIAYSLVILFAFGTIVMMLGLIPPIQTLHVIVADHEALQRAKQLAMAQAVARGEGVKMEGEPAEPEQPAALQPVQQAKQQPSQSWMSSLRGGPTGSSTEPKRSA